MADVYRKKGLPDRVVTSEKERVSAVFEGFKPAKDAPKAPKVDESKTDTKTDDAKKTEAPKPAAPKTN